MLTVAITTASIRSIFVLVDNSQKRECDLDPGCAIISMLEKTCHELALVYDPSIKIHMRSANGSLDSSLGLAWNVPRLATSLYIYKLTLYRIWPIASYSVDHSIFLQRV